MPRVYADDEVVTVRTADVRNTDLLAQGRGAFDGGYTSVGVVRCGWAGFSGTGARRCGGWSWPTAPPASSPGFSR
jgi:hypothetical protein